MHAGVTQHVYPQSCLNIYMPHHQANPSSWFDRPTYTPISKCLVFIDPYSKNTPLPQHWDVLQTMQCPDGRKPVLSLKML